MLRGKETVFIPFQVIIRSIYPDSLEIRIISHHVERKFSLGKWKSGMGLVTAKLEDTAAHVVALSILLLNLRKIRTPFYNFWIGYSAFCNRAKNSGLFSRHYLVLFAFSHLLHSFISMEPANSLRLTREESPKSCLILS